MVDRRHVAVDFIGVRQTKFGEEGNCLQAAVATITGVAIDEVVDVLDGTMDESLWFERLMVWAEERGWALGVYHPDDPPAGWSIATGKTVRSNQPHAVVAYSGVQWWDPHPEDKFLIEPEWFILWRKI